MSSAHVTDLLTPYIDNNLTKAQMERVKSHLIFCNACRQHLKDLESNINRLKSLRPKTPPQELEKRIFSRLASEFKEGIPVPASSQESPLHWFLNWKVFTVVATCALALFLIRSSGPHLNNKEEVVQPIKSKRSESKPVIAPAPVPPERQNEARADGVVGRSAYPFEGSGAGAQPAPKKAPVKMVDESETFPPEPQLRTKSAKEAEAKPDPASAEIGKNSLSSFRELSGQISGIEEPLEKLISTPRAWRNLWNQHVRKESPRPPVPAVDFEKSEVVAIFAGTKPTGGYAVKITKIEETSWEGQPARVVHYRVEEPPPGAISIMSLTQPFSLKTVPRFEGRTFFRRHP